MSDNRVTWLRQQIEERLRAAEAIDTDRRRWRKDSPDERGMADVVAEGPNGPVAAIAAADDEIAAHIAMNDPESVIANCKAELDMLRVHRRGNVRMPSAAIEQRCQECKQRYPCPTIRALASGYRNRPGWTGW